MARRGLLPCLARAVACLALVAGCAMPAPSADGATSATAGTGPEASSGAHAPATAGAPSSADASAPPSASATVAESSQRPSPTPDVGALDLDVVSCEGGVVLHWSVSQHPDFHHYSALRSPERRIDPAWPPIAPAVDWGDTYTTDRFVTSAIDASIVPSETTWYYRVVAYDAANRVLAPSPVRHAILHETDDLGPLTATATDDGVRLGWRPFDGRASCFSHYRVLAGSSGPASVVAIVSAQAAGELVTTGLRSGTTYQLRVEAVRTTALGSFVVAATEVLAYTVP